MILGREESTGSDVSSSTSLDEEREDRGAQVSSPPFLYAINLLADRLEPLFMLDSGARGDELNIGLEAE
eukprot:SAG31_NODE_4708_length_3019_cov_1.313699_3_plen_69_part_00